MTQMGLLEVKKAIAVMGPRDATAFWVWLKETYNIEYKLRYLEVDRLREAFDVPFCPDRGGIAPEDFWRCVDRWFRTYESPFYRAPVFTIVQASGTGKSRLLKEAALLRPLVYVTLECESAYPRGSGRIAAHFEGCYSDRHARDILADLLEFALLLWEEAGHRPEVLWDMMESVTSYSHQYQLKTSVSLEASTERLKQAFINFQKATKQRSVLVAIDEAHYLLKRNHTGTTPAFHLQLAARDLDSFAESSSRTNFGLLCVSTVSKVEKFVPCDCATKIFAPLYDVGGWTTLTELPRLSETSRLDWVCRFGRFLWSAIATTQSAEVAVRIADRKLRAEEHCVVACLGAVLHCYFPPSAPLAGDLVRDKMAILKFLADDQAFLVAEYPVEPLVALAAAGILWRTPLAELAKEIHFQSCLCNVFRGALGETVAMIRCLGACWNHRKISLMELITANEFLSTLLGVVVQPNCFNAHSQVGLTGFVKSQTVDHRALAWAFSLRLGFITGHCYPSIDLIIPVYLDGHKQDAVVNPERMTVVAVQVRNHEQPLTPAEFAAVADGMSKRLTSEGFAGACVVLQSVGSYQEHNGVYGASLVDSFPWLRTEEAAEEMQKLLRADVTITDYEKGSNSESNKSSQAWMEEVNKRSRPIQEVETMSSKKSRRT